MNKLLVGLAVALVVGALVVAGVAVSRPVKVDVSGVLGGSGSIRDFAQFFNAGGFRAGSPDPDNSVPIMLAADGVASTLTASSSQVCSNNVLTSTFSTATGTVTLPGGPDFEKNGTCLSTMGSSHSFFLYGANALAGTTTIAKGASSSLNFLSLNSSANASTTLFASSGLSRLEGVVISSSSQKWIIWSVLNFD